MPGCPPRHGNHNLPMPEKASHAATVHRDSTRVISILNRLSAPDIDRDAALHRAGVLRRLSRCQLDADLAAALYEGSRIPPTTHLRLRPDRCSRGSTLSGTYEPAGVGQMLDDPELAMSWQYTSRKPTGLSTSVTTSSHQSLPASGNPWDGRRTPTPGSSATTTPSAPTCGSSSTTPAAQPHRQRICRSESAS